MFDFLKFRESVNEKLELLRRDKKINKSSEVGVWITNKELLNRDFLKEICKVSCVYLVEGPEFKFEIKILRNLGYKECPRCQNYHIATLNFDFLCNRCTNTMLAFPDHPAHSEIVKNMKDRGIK